MKGRRFLGERRSMPLSSWPEQDRLAWEEALRPGDLFDQPSVAADWSPPRRRIVVQSYGCWLMWLSQRDILDPNRHAGDRVSTILFAEFINDLKQRVAPASVVSVVGGTKRMLEVIAPDHDWQWMRPLYRNLKRAVIPTKQKHTRVVESAALFDLGIRLFQQADAMPPDRPSRLILGRDGLMISLLAARPIRVGNLTSMEIGRHLVRSGGLYRLVFTRAETKVGRPIDLHCPAELTPYIDRYLEFYRPLLLARAKQPTATCRLWVNYAGGVMDISAIHYQIKIQTKRAFGHAINPHLFRDCAATSIAIHDPEHVRVATAILGHTCVSTTNKHYNQAQMLTAAREHNPEAARQGSVLAFASPAENRVMAFELSAMCNQLHSLVSGHLQSIAVGMPFARPGGTTICVTHLVPPYGSLMTTASFQRADLHDGTTVVRVAPDSSRSCCHDRSAQIDPKQSLVGPTARLRSAAEQFVIGSNDRRLSATPHALRYVRLPPFLGLSGS